MSNNLITQYIILALIIIAVIIALAKYIIKINRCKDANDACDCCSAKSVCKKVKKNQ